MGGGKGASEDLKEKRGAAFKMTTPKKEKKKKQLKS